MKKIFIVTMVMLIALPLLTGCFGVIIRDPIKANETGVIMHDGVSISSVVGAGRYGDSALYAKMATLDNSVRQIRWEGDDLWTKDKQPLDFVIIVNYHRTRDPEIIKELWGTYTHVFRDDRSLDDMVASRIPEAAKEMTVSDTLEGMLGIAEEGGRNKSQAFLFNELSGELLEFGVVLDNVTIDTITASDEYVAKLQEKANAQLQVELSQKLTLQYEEQINQEKAQTEISLEVARRNNLVAEEQAKVFEQSEEYLEIRKLELMGDIIGSNDKLIFLPSGTDLTMLFGETGNIIPVQ